MAATPRAISIVEKFTPALDQLSSAISQSMTFDSALSDTTFRIGIQEDVQYSLLPDMIRHVRVNAPNVRLVIQPTIPSIISSQLLNGEITVALGISNQLPANARKKTLRSIQPMLLRGDGVSAPISLEEYCERPQIVISHTGDVSSFADDWLAAIGRERKVCISLSHFSMLPSIMINSNLVTNLPDYLNTALTKEDSLRSVPLPFVTPRLELDMIWLDKSHLDPAEQWVRSVIEQFFSKEN